MNEIKKNLKSLGLPLINEIKKNLKSLGLPLISRPLFPYPAHT
jgi:hypothetical protein